jgi:hypothetical protein
MIMNTQLSPDRKAMFVEQDAREALNALMKAVKRTGGNPQNVIDCHCDEHIWSQDSDELHMNGMQHVDYVFNRHNGDHAGSVEQ